MAVTIVQQSQNEKERLIVKCMFPNIYVHSTGYEGHTFSSLIALILEPVSAIAATISSLLPMVISQQAHEKMNYEELSLGAVTAVTMHAAPCCAK